MPKSKRRVQEALDFYLGEIRRLYPRSSIQVMADTIEGTDAWIEVKVPVRSVIPAAAKFARLENEIDDRFGISFVTLTGSLNGKAGA